MPNNDVNAGLDISRKDITSGIVDKLEGAAAEIIEEAKTKADSNKDGKVSMKEWLTFFMNNPSLLFVVVLGMLAQPLVKFVESGLVSQMWDISIVTGALGSLIVPLIFGWFFKQNDSHTRGIVEGERAGRIAAEDKIEQVKYDNRIKLAEKDTRIHQLNTALQLKDQEIGYMEKGYVNGKHRPIGSENFNKE